MKPNTRAFSICAAGALISGRKPASVYDHTQGGYITISGSTDGRSVQLYDYDEGAHFSGNSNGKQFSFYHYSDGFHVSLTLNGDQFSGYDYGTGGLRQGT
jgi:hypothetical protein